jgi:hypothetical protein
LGSMHSRQGQAMRLVVTERSLAGAPNTLSLPHPGFANPAFCLSPTLSLFQPLSFHVHAPLHHGCKPPHSLPFSCLHFRHGNGTWNMELGLGQSGDAFCATDRKESENQPTAGRLSLSGSSAAGRMIGQPSRPYPAFVCLFGALFSRSRAEEPAGWLRLATGSIPTSLFRRSGLYRDGPRNELVCRVTSRWRASAHPARWDSGWQRPGSFPSVTGTTVKLLCTHGPEQPGRAPFPDHRRSDMQPQSRSCPPCHPRPFRVSMFP